MQTTQFRYAIKFVGDMDKAVKFYRDTLGLKLKFESPGWSEFVTGETTLALHPASDKNRAGRVELGFTVAEKVGLGFELPQATKPESHASQPQTDANCATCATNSADEVCAANA
jgi:catechol 2,3-dioxygenase-like lactoylglutathione lyase family enzyme